MELVRVRQLHSKTPGDREFVITKLLAIKSTTKVDYCNKAANRVLYPQGLYEDYQ